MSFEKSESCEIMQPMWKGIHRWNRETAGNQDHRTQIERKQKRSLTGISRDPPAELSTNEHHKSAITDHVCQNNHIMNWEASEIVEQESDKFKRWIKESICIRSNTSTMNGDDRAYQLSPIWTQVISTPNKDGWQSSKLSASLRLFLALFSENLNTY